MFNDDIPGIDAVAPARERGLKFLADKHNKKVCSGRSREGAWIEILLLNGNLFVPLVAPARERGLKFHYIAKEEEKERGRSREGAWIEIIS